LPAAKALSPVARRRLGKELDEWLSAEPPVPGMSVSATERLDMYVFFFFCLVLLPCLPVPMPPRLGCRAPVAPRRGGRRVGAGGGGGGRGRYQRDAGGGWARRWGAGSPAGEPRLPMCVSCT